MAGDAAITVLGSIIDKAITPVVNTVVRHLGYIFFYNRNIKNLEERVAKLEKSSNDADRFFQGQKRNNEEITASSAGWLQDVKEVIKDAKEVKEATSKLNGCLNLKGRYVQSRKSTKLVVKIQTLHNNAPEGITRNTILPAGSLPGALANDVSKGYKTRMQTMNEVMKALEDPAISVIGLSGLGGVGKTTMVHEVRERAMEQKLFDEVAMTTVSQNQDLFKIQGDLAEMLGLTSLKVEKNIIGRADHLRKRLTGGNKVLIILDDVWSDIKLADVGIPFGSGETKCKVIITSRQERVCSDMQKSIAVRVLAKDEARALFRKTAGECVKMYNLEKIADEVADECGGLPIALLTLSRALCNYKDSRAWEDARAQLRKGNATSIPGMEQNVYQSIKLSYDHLATQKQQEAQSLLLLCCQHREDVEIKVEMLARYCLSLELFEGVTGVVHARNRVHRLIEQLKSCFLLQAVGAADDEDIEWRDEAVKVHDVVRDVCLSMVSRHEADRDRVYMHIMEKKIDDSDKIGPEEEIDDADKIGTSEVDHPKIKLLMIPPGAPLHPTPSRQQMEELRVLEILSREYFGPEPYLFQFPTNILFQFPTNLRMLSLGGGFIHPHITSELSMLTELEVLSFHGSRIDSFPCIGKLRNLKLLDLRCRYQFRMDPIPSGILPGLTKLEVLYMGKYYFADKNLRILRDSTGLRGTEACISELDSLRNLTTLQIFLSNPMELLELKHLSFEKLERFHFSNEGSFYVTNSQSLCPTLHLKEVGIEWVFGDKIQSIIERTVDLSLGFIEDWTDPLIIERFASLRKLFIRGCHKIEYIIHDGDGIDNATHSGGGPSSSSSCSSVFKNLEILTIKDMNTVKELCHNGYLLEGSLYKLRELQLHDLPIMRHLWVGPTNPQCLVNLTKVKIMECVALECIFPHSAAKCLVHLQEIMVEKCSKLKGIMSKGGEETATGIETNIREETNKLLIHFPMLRKVSINGSGDFRGFYNLEDGRGQPLFNQLVMLPRIEHLDVRGLHQLKQITGGKMPGFPTLAAANWLQNLNRLSVENCKSLESVFDFEGQQVMGEENTHVVTLTKLKNIVLRSLSNLTHIFRCPLQYISVPELRIIEVYECDGLVNGFPSNLIMGLQNLGLVFVANCESLKAVFDFEGVKAMTIIEDAGSLLCELREITLINLPRLEHLCRQVPKEVHSIFQNLMTLQVEDCGSLAYLIPSSIAHMLVNLRNLLVKSCKGMQEVVYNMNEEDYSELEKKVVFRSLTRVKLVDLENLLSFCSSDQQVFEFPSLETLSISYCPGIETFCCQVPSVAYSRMSGGNVSKGEGTSISGGGEIKKVPLPTDLVAQFPKLKEVILRGTPKFRGFYNIDNDNGRLLPLYHPLVMLPTMEELEVYNLRQLKQIVGFRMPDIPSFGASDWQSNLQRLVVRGCDSLESVFDFEGFEVTREDAQAVLSKLETILLHQLPNLEHICRQVPKEVNGFQNLRRLFVAGCDSLSYLLTSTMAHMLVNLKTLVVWKCKSMKEVVKMTEDCGENKIVFLSLRHLELGSLEKLSSFCSAMLHEFGFPSLDQVKIIKCPAMKTFCCGHVTAEKLQGVYFDNSSLTHEDNDGGDDDENGNDDDIENEDDDDDDGYKVGGDDDDADGKVVWKSDVNETIRHFNGRVKQMKSDLKEDGVDDDGTDDVDKDNDDDKAEEELDGNDVGDKPLSVAENSESDLNEDRIVDSDADEAEGFDDNHDDEDGPVANHVDSSDAVDKHVNDRNISKEGDHDQNVRHGNEVSDHNGTTSSPCVEEGTSSKPRKALVAPDASLALAFVSPPPPLSENNDELAHSSSPNSLPGPIEPSLSASSEHTVPTSDSPLQTKTDKKLSDASLSTSYDDWKSGRILIHGVYIKAEMKKTFEEILTANPDFLSGLRFKKAEIKTVFVESAISSLQCLRQYTARTMHEEQLTSIKEFLDDLAPSGLDITWLERGYQRACLVMKEKKAVLAATELARLEKKKVEAEAAFEMARAELKEVMAQRDASKAECDALLQEVEAGKEVFGGGFDQEASLGDGLLN